MPSRNVLKYDLPEAYYHVYARGISKGRIFLEQEDYLFFALLFARYLSVESKKDRNGLVYPHLFGRLELLAYCLMPNHFHLLIYQHEGRAMKTLMQAMLTSYSRYFNKKYKRSGSLFETRYKASMVADEKYLEHVSRYIHLNPREWRTYPYSSLQYYFAGDRPEHLIPDRIEQLFTGRQEYLSFLQDYIATKRSIELAKDELPDFY